MGEKKLIGVKAKGCKMARRKSLINSGGGFDRLAYAVLAQAVEDYRHIKKSGLDTVKQWPVDSQGNAHRCLTSYRNKGDVLRLENWLKNQAGDWLYALHAPIDHDTMLEKIGAK